MTETRRSWSGVSVARWVASLAGACGITLVLVVGSQGLHAQETTGLQAAIALEHAMTESIERCEKSVVSIARVKPATDDLSAKMFRPEAGRLFIDPFGQRHIPSDNKPDATSPDFVPNDFGTGVVIDRSGLILTNYHLLDADSDHYVTTIDRKVFRTEIKAADPRSDLAVLQVKDRFSPSDFVPMPLGNAKTLKKGHIVLSLGNPYSIARDGQVSCSWGIVSNLSRKVATPKDDSAANVRDPIIHDLGNLIQTDAKLNLGTSGGALVNLKGEMVGLTSALSAITGYDQAAGYAIPVDDTFRRIVDTLKQGREVEYGFLGIMPMNLRPDEVLNGKHGVRIESNIRPGTPAFDAGLENNDVITHVGDDAIYNADGLRLMVGKLPPSAHVRLTFERNGHIHSSTVTLAKHGLKGKRQRIVTVMPPEWRGLQVDYSSVALAIPQADVPTVPCVVITDVRPDSPAAKAGLNAGMFVTHVDNTTISTPDEFRNEVTKKSGEVKLLMSYLPGMPNARIVKPDSEKSGR